MTKVHPNRSNSSAEYPSASSSSSSSSSSSTVLTVWRKSLLFNGSGFTVFDAAGGLLFRVENYSSSSPASAGVVLMDAVGTPLYTIRKKRLSFGDQWLVFSGEETSDPLFSVKKHVGLVRNPSKIARVTPLNGGDGSVYVVVGSYTDRNCVIYDDRQRKVADVGRKEAPPGGARFGNDVFRLVVEDVVGSSAAMAIIISLDQMF